MAFVICEDIKSLQGKIKKVAFSELKNKSYEFARITARPFNSKKGVMWQLEKHKNNQVFHENLTEDKFIDWLSGEAKNTFRQICLTAEGSTIHYTVFDDKTKRKETANTIKTKAQSHNKEKSYILKQGENIPALVDLGVFSKDFTIVKSKYDKFKQINRFIEIIDDEFTKLGKDEITILDFGCGKSYLTFIVYYYFTQIKKIKANVIGYDLKADVVENCNEIAKRYGYENLKFFVNDVSKDELYKGNIDMVITLHACDIATDFALFHAISNGVGHIFSVPCCQHEICRSIKKGGDFDLLLNHGLIKERFSALLTDSIRAEILKECGYEVDIVEFVDFAHSPKNLMLRCKLKKKKAPDLDKIRKLTKQYGFNQKLLDLLS